MPNVPTVGQEIAEFNGFWFSIAAVWNLQSIYCTRGSEALALKDYGDNDIMQKVPLKSSKNGNGNLECKSACDILV